MQLTPVVLNNENEIQRFINKYLLSDFFLAPTSIRKSILIVNLENSTPLYTLWCMSQNLSHIRRSRLYFNVLSKLRKPILIENSVNLTLLENFYFLAEWVYFEPKSDELVYALEPLYECIRIVNLESLNIFSTPMSHFSCELCNLYFARKSMYSRSFPHIWLWQTLYTT